MEERTVRRIAALAGFAFVVVLIVSVVLTIGPPMPDKSTAKIVKWFVDHRERVYTSEVLGGLATIAVLWFLGYLYHALSRLAGGARAIASIMLTSGIATAAVASMSGLAYATLAFTVSRPGASPSDDLVHMLTVLNGFEGVLIGFGLTLFLLAFGLLLSQGNLKPRWAAWVAYIGSAGSLIGSVGGGFFLSKAGKGNPLGLFGFLGLILFLVTMLAISSGLLSAEEPATV